MTRSDPASLGPQSARTGEGAAPSGDLTTEFAQELAWLYDRVKDTDPDIPAEFGRSVDNARAYLAGPEWS